MVQNTRGQFYQWSNIPGVCSTSGYRYQRFVPPLVETRTGRNNLWWIQPLVKATNGQSDQWIEKPLVKTTTAQKGERMKSNKEALARVNISMQAHDYLEELTQRCNVDFEAGKVNRSTLASWVVLWFKSQEKAKHISMIQKAHFDPLKHLYSFCVFAGENIFGTTQHFTAGEMLEENPAQFEIVQIKPGTEYYIQESKGGFDPLEINAAQYLGTIQSKIRGYILSKKTVRLWVKADCSINSYSLWFLLTKVILKEIF